MRVFRSRGAAALAIIATLSLSASPASARDRHDWGRHHRHRGGGGIDAGSLLAGLLVGGAAVAIATSANRNSNTDRAGTPDDEPAPYRYPGGPVAGEPGYGEPSDDAGPGDRGPAAVSQGRFGEAVDACSAELERGGKRIASVDGVRRMGERYGVEGRLEDGPGYACSVDDAGQIRSVAVDGHAMI